VAVARQVDLAGDDPEAVAGRLREWQERRDQALQEYDGAQAEWAELQSLLAGRSVDDLTTRATEHEDRAGQLAAEFTDTELKTAEASGLAARSAAISDELRTLDQQFAHERGQVDQLAKHLASVPETEERLALEEEGLGRVRALADTLNRTIEFLQRAQSRVHRQMAPVLENSVREWLPQVAIAERNGTVAERDWDAEIDRETLEVRVQIHLPQGPDRKPAELLSEGTKEQIYLLLGAALAEHLTTPGERCPLILDEVTAQCDSLRRDALLGLLHELSANRQVILFTHDSGARDWAQQAFQNSADDLLIVRDPLP
jgi:exonuclease SbcC